MVKTVISLHVAIGDTIFVIPSKVNFELNIVNNYHENNRIYKQKIHSIQWWDNENYMLITCEGICSVRSDSRGQTWFIDEENAEVKLRQLEENSKYLLK